VWFAMLAVAVALEISFRFAAVGVAAGVEFNTPEVGVTIPVTLIGEPISTDHTSEAAFATLTVRLPS
jgi:hypothetical protein